MPEMPEKQSAITDLVLDLDNTLWDWVGMHIPALEAMAWFVSDQAGVPLEIVKASMAKVYRQAGTHEYTPLVQNMDILAPLLETKAGVMKLIGIVLGAQETYDAHREKNLALYDGVPDVLNEIHGMGVRMHVISDAPKYKALSRIKLTGIEQFFTSLHAKPDPCESELPEYVAAKQAAGQFQVPFPVGEVPNGKPDIDLGGLLGIPPDDVKNSVAVIGDSLPKDMGLARRNNCLGILASYGNPTAEQVEHLLRFGTRDSERLKHMPLSNELVRLIQETRIHVLERVRDLPAFLKSIQ